MMREIRSGKARAEVSRRQGKWGEATAADYLCRRGWVVIGQNVRPCFRDRRCEIDLIMGSGDGHEIVFVEVKTHRFRNERAPALWGVDRRKKLILRRACLAWLQSRKWAGNYRFDVVEVYGESWSNQAPEVRHYPNVRLFPASWRFWKR